MNSEWNAKEIRNRFSDGIFTDVSDGIPKKLSKEITERITQGYCWEISKKKLLK